MSVRAQRSASLNRPQFRIPRSFDPEVLIHYFAAIPARFRCRDGARSGGINPSSVMVLAANSMKADTARGNWRRL